MTWTIHPITQFDRFRRSWDRVNHTGSGTPFLHSSFVGHALRAFGSGEELLAVRADPAGDNALAVVSSKGKGAWETFQPAQLPLGAWVMSPGLDYGTVLEELLGGLPGAALLIGVSQQDPQLHPRPENSGALETLDYINTAWVEVDGGFDSYWAARGKNLRQNMRRQRAKLDAESVKTELEVIAERERVADAIAAFGRLESAGWKGERVLRCIPTTPKASSTAQCWKTSVTAVPGVSTGTASEATWPRWISALKPAPSRSS